MTDVRGKDGKRTRGTKEWLRAQGDDEVQRFRIYCPKEDKVMEGWKNTRTKQRIITALRRPQGDELEEFRRKADAKGRIKDMENATREYLGGRPIS